MSLVEEFKKSTSIQIVSHRLSDTQTKKEALKKGVSMANYEIIATTDADCILPKDWLLAISNNLSEDTTMLLGPVIFSESKGLLGVFQLLDMFAIQGLTFGLLFYKKPILNNAANLAYNKDVYIQVKGYDQHATPSGDDIFLLEKFKTAKKKISGVLNKEFVVETRSEESLKDFFNQRIRWASKSSYYKDKLLLFISTLIFIINISALFIYVVLLFVEEMRIIGIIFLLSKWLIDFILLFLVSSFFDKRRTLLYFIPVQIIYPIYIIVIGLVSRFYKFEWKGRAFNEK
jgi:cellulose synthase/poly-beta-1,6-N-acetylglucosamine synthase-like glycosyltransferase